uniref:ORF G protein n=1 Tax=Streptomyces kasugaensis TaxID=1946 RepID=O66160_STRKA|nr:ORF G [Streptomyces kasugaensis]
MPWTSTTASIPHRRKVTRRTRPRRAAVKLPISATLLRGAPGSGPPLSRMRLRERISPVSPLSTSSRTSCRGVVCASSRTASGHGAAGLGPSRCPAPGFGLSAAGRVHGTCGRQQVGGGQEGQ